MVSACAVNIVNIIYSIYLSEHVVALLRFFISSLILSPGLVNGMAAAAVDDFEIEGKIEAGWDQVKGKITCLICRNIFTDPRTLECSHTFCRQCIDDRAGQAKVTESLDTDEDEDDHEYINTAAYCPQCMAPLPPDGASSACTATSTNSLILIFQRREYGQGRLVEVTCGNCSEEFQQVTTWCLMCHCALCTSCNALHGAQKRFNFHTTVDIAELVQTCRRPCRIHRSKQNMMDLYCTTCQLLACPECIEEAHLEHEFDLVNKKLKGAQQIITPLREMAERACERNKKAVEIPRRQTKNMDPPLYVGMYDFLATEYNELSFSKGDLLYIISDDGDWWFAKAKETGQEGYIPRTFITEHKSLEDYE